MNVAVTGGSGQLGTLVLRRLLADRSVKAVTCLDLRPPAVAGAKLRWIEADIRDPSLHRHLEGCEALVHLAFVVTVYLPRETYDAINVGGSRNVFEAAARAGIRRIVYSSSIAAYGVVKGHPEPIVETTPRVHQKEFPYASAKYEVEAFLDGFERAHPEIAIARLRPSILLGAQMDHALGRGLKKGELADLGDTAPMPIVWDEDVADAAILALKKEARGAFNLGTEESLGTAELARAGGLKVRKVPKAVALGLIRLAAAVRPGRATDPAWLAVDNTRMIVSSERARTELGWTPRCRTAAEVVQRFMATVPRRPDRRIAVFMRGLRLVARARPPDERVRGEARIHLALTGPGGGDWGVLMGGGRLSIQEGIPRPPTAVVLMPATTFLQLLAGKGDFTSLQLTGKVRVEGEPTAAMVVAAMISMFRTATGLPGAVGWTARKAAAWFDSGAKT